MGMVRNLKGLKLTSILFAKCLANLGLLNFYFFRDDLLLLSMQKQLTCSQLTPYLVFQASNWGVLIVNGLSTLTPVQVGHSVAVTVISWPAKFCWNRLVVPSLTVVFWKQERSACLGIELRLNKAVCKAGERSSIPIRIATLSHYVSPHSPRSLACLRPSNIGNSRAFLLGLHGRLKQWIFVCANAHFCVAPGTSIGI